MYRQNFFRAYIQHVHMTILYSAVKLKSANISESYIWDQSAKIEFPPNFPVIRYTKNIAESSFWARKLVLHKEDFVLIQSVFYGGSVYSIQQLLAFNCLSKNQPAL